MGSFDKKSKSSSQQQQTATTTPQIPDYLQGPIKSYFGSVGDMVNQNPNGVRIGPTNLESQALEHARSFLGPNAAVQQGVDQMRGLFGYAPQSVQTQWNANTITGPDRANYQASLMSPAPNVAAGQLASTDLTSYLNPWTGSVIDAGVSDLNRAREMAISGGQGSATLSGAFGGSRHGVADAETNRGFLDQVGSLTANLRSAGFQNAQQAALTDIGNRLGADQFNATNALTVGARNQDAENAFTRDFASSLERAQLANQAAQESAASRSLTGQTANQGADLSAAGLRLNAGQQAASAGIAAEASNRANQQAILNAAQYQRGLDEANDPTMARMRYLQMISQLLGINGGDVIGQQIDSSGSASGTNKQGGGLSFGFGPDGFSFGYG